MKTKETEYLHRLECIQEDISVIANFIKKSFLDDEFKKTTGVAEEAWHHISNIEIACDLGNNEPLNWSCVTSK